MITHKKIIGSALICATLISPSLHAADLSGKTFFSGRSQGSNTARRLAIAPVLYDLQAPHDCIRFATNVDIGYQHSYKTQPVANHFFSDDVINVTGSQVDNRGPKDWLADYFGLSPSFSSAIFFKPTVANTFADFSAYVELDHFPCAAYMYFHMPVVHSSWHFELEEVVLNNGASTPYPAQYMSVGELTAPASSMQQAMQGNITFGDVSQSLAFGKTNCRPLSLTRIADIHIELGWYAIKKERARLAYGLFGVIPTGNRPKGEYIFEPVVGNGHHPAIGATINGHFTLWEKDYDQTFAIHGIANMSYLFKAHQIRSFDLQSRQADCFVFFNKFASRYMLVKEFDSNGVYSGVCSPLINHSSLNCKVWIPFYLDASLMAAYRYRGWGINIGYNIWARSREHINCNLLLPKNLALKGIQNVKNGVLNSSVTQSKATIYGNNFADQAIVSDGATPVLIHPTDLDISSAEHSGILTNKFFGDIGYAWHTGTDCRLHPFLGVGGEIEFLGSHAPVMDQYNHAALAQWGFWFTFGVNY